jgi:YNFM family putative membrane transporter
LWETVTAITDASAKSAADLIDRGTPRFRRTNLGLFAAGVATFGLLYCVQPLMPQFSRQFGVPAAISALSLSLTSAVLAVTILFAGPISDAWSRKGIMTASLLSSAILVLLSAVAPTWQSFLVLRALLGLTLGGVPAVAMTYLAEEFRPNSIGLGMGLYISGNAAGGLGGRLIAGILADLGGWRAGIATVGAVGAAAAVLFIRCLPPSAHFKRKPFRWRSAVQRFSGLFSDAGLPWLFAEGFVLLGGFVTVYNYSAYRLMAPPYGLSQAGVGLLFSVYVVGIFSSSWIGHQADRLGRRKVLWTMFVTLLAGLGMTLFQPLGVIIAGVVVVTFGFFGGHSIVSSWVGRRGGGAKAQAAAAYLFAYYMGSSCAGAAGGLFYARYGWNGVALFVALLFTIGLLISWRLYRLAPLATVSPEATLTPMP